MNAVKIKHFTGRKKQSGATLVVIIITMLVVAVVGIALYSITDTSTMNQSVAQRAAKAFYLAESGIRIAASEYKAALGTSTTNADTKLANLNAKTFSMTNNQGQIKIELYPYWFYLPAASAPIAVTANTTTSIILYLPGAVPPTDDAGTTAITFPVGGQLKYKNGTYTETYNTATPGIYDSAKGTPVTFTFTSIHHNTYTISPGDEFYLGYGYNSTATPAAAGGSLTLADPNSTWQIFPPHNGRIFVDQPTNVCQYSYGLRDTSVASTITLTNIQFIQCINLAQGGTYIPPVPFFPASTDTPYQYYIYIGKSLGVRSTATYGN
jgi:hypothetical protein